MQKLLISISVLFISCFSVRAETPSTVNLQVFVSGQHEKQGAEIYGSFSTKEGQYGGLEIVFFRELGKYSVRPITDMGSYVARSNEKNSHYDTDYIDAILNIFVMPVLIKDGDIHISGSYRIFENTASGDEPLYGISEDLFTGVVANGGDTVLAFYSKPSGKKINLKLVAETSDQSHLAADSGDILFDALFSLYNEDNNRFEIENEPCKLWFNDSNDQSDARCLKKHIFHLDNGDSLLYMVVFNLEKAYRRNDGMVQMELIVDRWFFLNPEKFFTDHSPSGAKGATFGEGHRSLETTISIDGKKRRVEAEIKEGTVIGFKWDGDRFSNVDIIANWNDIVSILTQIEKGKYIYRPPQGGLEKGASHFGRTKDLIGSPINYTGSSVTSTKYKKEIMVSPVQELIIEIPISKGSLLPFRAHETIIIHQAEDPDPQE
jgi:hypothetical protein